MNIAIVLAVAFGSSQAKTEVIVPSVQLRPMHDIEVPALETGPLIKLIDQESEEVSEGTVLAEIDPSDAQSAVAEAIADYEVTAVEANSELSVSSAQMDHDAATRNRKRADEANALRPGSVLEFELDKLRLAEAQTKLTVEQAKLGREKAKRMAAAKSERVARAKERLKRHTVVSPVSGSIVESHFEQGEWVEAGQVLARVIQVDQLKAEGMLTPAQAASNLLGAPVVVNVKVGDRMVTLKGTVTFVSPEARSGKIRFRAVVENPLKLVRPGLQDVSLTIRPLGNDAGAKTTGSRR